MLWLEHDAAISITIFPRESRPAQQLGADAASIARVDLARQRCAWSSIVPYLSDKVALSYLEFQVTQIEMIAFMRCSLFNPELALVGVFKA
jgi:hypothetical protein